MSHMSFDNKKTAHQPLLPEWGELEVDDASWIAALEAARREQFAELADL